MANWKFYLDNIEVEEPIGWDGVEFTAVRMPNHGIDQPFSTEVKFYAEGAKYIKGVYDQYFINEPIAIKIVSDVVFDGVAYEFNGFLNLSIYEEHNVCDTDSFEITVGILDDNFREKFKARQDVEIDLNEPVDLDGKTIPSLPFKSIRLHRQELYISGAAKSLQARSVTQPSNSSVIVPIYWQVSDFTGQFGTTTDTSLSINTPQNMGQSPFLINQGSTARTFYTTGSFTMNVVNNHPNNTIDVEVFIRLYSGNSPGAFWHILLPTIQGPSSSINYNISWTNLQFSVPIGVKAMCLVYAGYGGNPYPADVTINNDVVFNLEEYSGGQYASIANVLTIEQWLRRCIEKMTGSPNKLISDVFSESGGGCYWNNALTTGTRIRRVDGVSGYSQCPTSWKKTFEELDKIFCLGWGYEWNGGEWKIRVEPREYFYQNTITGTFPDVGEVTQSALSDKMINNVILGYTDKWKNIQLNGLYAIHTDRNYFVDNTALDEGASKKLDIRSEIIAEGYAIEFLRRLSSISFGAKSSDRPNDYDTFIIWLNRNAAYEGSVEYSPWNLIDESGPITFPAGTVSWPSKYINTSNSVLDNLYNIFHTPARIAMRWWKVLGMNAYGLANPKLRYQVGQYQTDYSSYIDDTIGPCQQYCVSCLLSEKADIDPAFMRPADSYVLFKPIEIKFQYPQSLCDFLNLSENTPYGRVKLTSGSFISSGYISKIANRPEDGNGGVTDFVLLMSGIDEAEQRPYDTEFNNAYQ